MTVGRIFGILIFSSLAATGATLAKGAGIKGDHLLPTSRPASARHATLAGGIPKATGIKGDHPLPTSVPASARHAEPQAPIVMGRSVSAHHKTKLHHIKMELLESIETPVAADIPR
ncbi:MAG TPA: hypothetical protein VGP28_00255 [Methylocella sp.]|jgi:hypothetical protein|nr:hypothetical protein [Methylocella sp.]